MAKIGKWFITFFLFSLHLWAQVSVQLQVESNNISMDENVVASVIVTSQKDVDIQEPRIPQLDAFKLTNTWKSSSSQSRLMQTPQGMQFQTTKQVNFNYQLAPEKSGDLKIGSFEVVVDGKVYKTQPIYIKVDNQGSGSKHRPSQNSQGTNQGMFPDDDQLDSVDEAEKLFNQMVQRHFPQNLDNEKFKTQPKNEKDSFFVQVELDKTAAYEGEQILANWYVYVRGDLLSLDRLKFPNLKGFWKEDIEVAPSISFETEVVNGVPYKKALIASHALFPIKPGTAIIDEYKIKVALSLASDPFSSFGFGKPYSITRSSERVKIQVKPLPNENKPKDFSGAVGTFSVSAKVEGDKHVANQPLSLKIRFEGYGNAKLIELPQIEYPQGLEYYDTQKTSKFFRNGLSYKDFEVTFVPRQSGKIKIPSFSVSLFDPKKGEYYQKSTEPIELDIEPDLNNNNKNAESLRVKTPGKKEETPTVFVMPTLNLKSESSLLLALLHMPNHWIWVALIIIHLVLVIWVLILRKKVTAKDLLKKKAHERLSDIKVLVKEQKVRDVGAEMINLFLVVLNEQSGVSGSYEAIAKMIEKLPPSLRDSFGSEIQKYLEEMNYLGFAPDNVLTSYKQGDSLNQIFEHGKKLIERLLNL